MSQYYAKRMRLDEETRRLAYVNHRDLGRGVAPRLIPRGKMQRS